MAERLRKAQNGHLGDVRSVGNGVHEMREHVGPGWRMYFAQRGGHLICMLGGGGKPSQQTDIQRAIQIAARLEE